MTASADERRHILTQVSAGLATNLEELWRRAEALPSSEFPGFMVDAIPELSDPYVAAAGTLSADWFDQSVPNARAVEAPMRPHDPLKVSVKWALSTTRGEAALPLIKGTLQRAVFNGARDTTIYNVGRNAQTRWARVATSGACEFCRMLVTRPIVSKGKLTSFYGSKESALQAGLGRGYTGTRAKGDRFHDNCVPAGTLVAGPSTETAYRRWYEGEVVIISTAGGHELTITPNHPVLTDQGWVPAGTINRGDNVVCALGGDTRASTVPHEDDHPAPIEEVWGALLVDGLTRVPVSSEDFHGDGLDGEVDVVRAFGDLNARLDGTFMEEVEQRRFAAALRRGPRSGFPIAGLGATLIPGAGSSSGGRMGGGSELLALFGGCPLHSDHAGGRPISRHDAEFVEMAAYGAPTDAELLGALQLGHLLVDVEFTQSVGVQFDPVSARFDPAGFEFVGEGRGVYASRGLDLRARLAGDVELDRVIECRRSGFSGHVYNLQTENGWYSAGSVIVSNCRCQAIEIPAGGSIDLASYVGDWVDEYKAARKLAGTGETKDVLAAWRSLDSFKASQPVREPRAAGAGSKAAAKAADRPATSPGQPPTKPPRTARRSASGDFERDREEYRAKPITERELDERFADDLGSVFDRILEEGTGPAEQLARDLSGTVEARRGRFTVDFHEPVVEAERIILRGRITRDGQQAGIIERTLRRAEGVLSVENNAMFLESADQGRGFATAFAPILEDYYRRSGVDRITVWAASDNGGYTWAAQGFRWAPGRIVESISNVVQRLNEVLATAKSNEDRQALAEMIARLIDESGDVRPAAELPTPAAIARLATSHSPTLGRTVMIGSKWHGVKYP